MKKCQLSSHNGPISNRFFFWSTIVTGNMGTLADHSPANLVLHYKWKELSTFLGQQRYFEGEGEGAGMGWHHESALPNGPIQFKAEYIENDLRCSPCSSFWRRDASLGRRRSGRRRLGTGSCRPPPSSWSENLTNDKLEIWTNFQMSTVDVMQRLYFVSRLKNVFGFTASNLKLNGLHFLGQLGNSSSLEAIFFTDAHLALHSSSLTNKKKAGHCYIPYLALKPVCR